MDHLERCPHCGRKIYPDRYTYTFRKWGTPALLALISLMLFAFDLIRDGDAQNWSVDWAHWATLGIWIFYIPVQLLRSSPNYGWVIVPFIGIEVIIYLIFLDRLHGANSGFLNLDWSWYAIIPLFTFIVAFPIVSHYARKELTPMDQLKSLVDTLERQTMDD